MRLGLDVGSTTIKYVVLDEQSNVLCSDYQRHYSHVAEKTTDIFADLNKKFPGQAFQIAVSGSAGMGLAEQLALPFAQEVFATRIAAAKLTPGANVVIELGGEDAKVLFLTDGVEVG